ncbi:MAG TPA: AI-2E family transporter, partial [Isosphaeraceae bacterium]|nr:AI-2E family transporter [Isosphaeraceae bacterium]
MADRSRSWTWNHPVVKLFVIIAVVASMSLAAEFLRPLAVAILLAFALSSPAKFFERKGLPRVPSVLLTVSLTLALLGGISYVVYSQVNTLAADLPKYQDNFKEKLQGLFPRDQSNIQKAQKAISEAVEGLDEPKLNPDVRDV